MPRSRISETSSADRVVVVSAPGKLILSGEHSVVYGHPALATALQLRLSIRLERCHTNSIALISQTFSLSLSLEKYAEWWADPSLRLNDTQDNIERIKELISAEFEVDSGQISEATGGNGTFTTHERGLIRDLASTCENIFHSRSSGIDTTVIIEGGLIKYQPGNFEPFQINHSPRILIVETHVERSTAQLVEFVRRRRDRLTDIVNGVMSALSECVHKWLELFQSEDILGSYQQQRELVEINQHLLASLGVSHASLDAIVSAASEVGLAAKLTGAGGAAARWFYFHRGEIKLMIALFELKKS
ncbi:Oidioi.mRNA.OKI2018_I69.chr2.g6580.t1.cds [Oikopleura dioica]|uniref:Oidioi.mRNA.OKI2018_I69.chr2.g6580.t1.cds n=1 Tax=Oikopleura dioica TaxID=34765 RepID=A0ABN7T8A0_OIKDI|nr:Oidioi.mRNA.OKI2018_I69.chr2.g6580.t1.cds [Oikopleura dioica]